MNRFARFLADGMKLRDHEVHIWSPKPRFFKIPGPPLFQKWFGYVDQFLIFPFEVRRRLKMCSADTLFVFTDQALGPWIPLAASRPHVIHCHDFIAQRSALGKLPGAPMGWTGRVYQSYIRQGYMQGKCFISVSQKTKLDLHYFLKSEPIVSEVVFNGLNQLFVHDNQTTARRLLGEKINLKLSSGYILHVGSNMWYKNRLGVIEIYEAFRSISQLDLPLLLIGEPPSIELKFRRAKSAFKTDIIFLNNVDDESIRLAYSGAAVFLFPSLEEGFGWPIAEAMASGCLVITTNQAPMTEVAGSAGFLIERRPSVESHVDAWAVGAAKVVIKVLCLTEYQRQERIESGLLNAKRFNPQLALNLIEEIYKNII